MNNEYSLYCLDCKCHLCKEFLKSRVHKTHNKINLEEEQPNEEELNIIKNKIQYYKDKIKNIKEKKIEEFKKELNINIIKENKRTKK